MRSAGCQGFAEKVEQPDTLGGNRLDVRSSEIAVQFAEKQPGVGLLIEAPDEQAVGSRRAVRREQFVEQSSCNRGLPSAAEPDEGDDASWITPPPRAQRLQFQLPPHKVGSRRQSMNQTRLRRMHPSDLTERTESAPTAGAWRS